MTLGCLTAKPLAPLQHGFFTRAGGASSGIFSSLNCGPGSSDQSGAVAVNRARVAAAMRVPAAALLTLHQHHSPDVVTLKAPFAARPKADAMVTAQPGLALGILTADCAPILFADRTAGVVGAAHAGWRGALYGVVEATVAAMAVLGARRAGIAAVIGPTISQAAYEVGPEFRDRFLAVDAASARFFAEGSGDRLQFDLPGYLLSRLAGAGLTGAVWLGQCTYGDPQRFFSYRRSCHAGEADYGRLISTIRL